MINYMSVKKYLAYNNQVFQLKFFFLYIFRNKKKNHVVEFCHGGDEKLLLFLYNFMFCRVCNKNRKL